MERKLCKKKVLSIVKSNEGVVKLNEVNWNDGTITYDVIKLTSKYSTTKGIMGLKNFETACKRYNKYAREMAEEYIRKCEAYYG